MVVILSGVVCVCVCEGGGGGGGGVSTRNVTCNVTLWDTFSDTLLVSWVESD